MESVFTFDTNKQPFRTSGVFSSALEMTRRQRGNVDPMTKNNNMAETIYRSLEQGSERQNEFCRKSDTPKRLTIETEPKSKTKNFSIRSLLDQDLKSPSDSGYGSGSPSPNESVLSPGSCNELEGRLENNLKLSRKPKESENLSKPPKTPDIKDFALTDNASQFLPFNTPSLPVEYQNLLYAMNARFLEWDSAGPRRQDEKIRPPNLEIFRQYPQFLKPSTNDEKAIGDGISSSGNGGFANSFSSERRISAEYKNEYSSNSKTDLPQQPTPEQCRSESSWGSEFDSSFDIAKTTFSNSGPIPSTCTTQQDYFQQLTRVWWDNAVKTAENFANRRQTNPFTLAPSYWNRLQMFLAASAAASAVTTRSPISPPTPYFPNLISDVQKFNPVTSFTSTNLKRGNDKQSKCLSN